MNDALWLWLWGRDFGTTNGGGCHGRYFSTHIEQRDRHCRLLNWFRQQGVEDYRR
jgi:hypothetical protein